MKDDREAIENLAGTLHRRPLSARQTPRSKRLRRARRCAQVSAVEFSGGQTERADILAERAGIVIPGVAHREVGRGHTKYVKLKECDRFARASKSRPLSLAGFPVGPAGRSHRSPSEDVLAVSLRVPSFFRRSIHTFAVLLLRKDAYLLPPGSLYRCVRRAWSTLIS